MSYRSSINLALVDDSQQGKEDTANMLLAALASAGMYGIKQSASSGLTLVLYGGVMLVAGVPTIVANQTLTLTNNATNYIYADSAGAAHKVTSAPTGWPTYDPDGSPIGVFALYQLVVSGGEITSGTNYVPSIGRQGEQGEVGDQGPDGSSFFDNSKRVLTYHGCNTTTTSSFGFGIFSGGPTARPLSSSTFRQTIPYAAHETIASANQTAQAVCARNFCYLGDSAGRGGFTVSFRFCFESSFAATNGRCFIGLTPASTIFTSVEPNTLTNIIGVGANAGEANLSIMHNDSTGNATKTTIVSDDSPSVNFPAKAANKVYELTLHSEPNSQLVSWELLDCELGHVATGNISSNLPSNTTFLSIGWMVNTGAAASAHAIGMMQVIAETPN